jgi:acyl-CoA synthetase (AMP-forming)/AMP-acid ligase II
MLSHDIAAGDGLPLTLPHLIRQQAERHGDHVFLVVDDQRLTYAEADARSRLLARGLLAMGMSKGMHAAFLLPNSPDLVVTMLAAARIGMVLVPFSTFSTPDELRWLLRHADPVVLFTSPAFRNHDYRRVLPDILPGLDLAGAGPLHSSAAPLLRRIFFTGGSGAWSVAALEQAASQVDEPLLEAAEDRVSPADRLVIIHTSGSTGTPKGVIYQHGALLRHVANLNELRPYRAGDVLFTGSPYFWIGGFAYTFLSTFMAGGRHVCSNATAAADVLDLIERERPTMTNGYAQSVNRLAADPSFPGRDLSFLRRGNLYPIMPPDVRPADAELRHGAYGMTESGSTMTFSPDESDLPERLRGSFGKLVPGFEAKIVDPETLRPCATGEVGEIWFRGPLMMEGYYGRPRSEVFEADGWFRGGDLGCFDAEGHFYFKGRRGDIIKTAGTNVAPREVEAVLRALTGDRQCLVVGLPDRERGQVVVAAVVSDEPVDAPALTAQLKEKLSSYKVPRHIIRLAPPELPVMSSGKTDMPRLKALLTDRIAARGSKP